AKQLNNRIDFTYQAYQVLTGVRLPGRAARLGLTAPPSVTAGVPFTVTLTALDESGGVARGYNGVVTFTSADRAGSKPGPYRFTVADSGTHDFPVTLNTAGKQTVKVRARDPVYGTVLTLTFKVTVDAPAAGNFLP